MKRWHEEIHLMLRRAKSYMFKKLECGHCRKSKPLDCGNPKCTTCHSEKYPKRELTIQEQKSIIRHKEGEEEIGPSN